MAASIPPQLGQSASSKNTSWQETNRAGNTRSSHQHHCTQLPRTTKSRPKGTSSRKTPTRRERRQGRRRQPIRECIKAFARSNLGWTCAGLTTTLQGGDRSPQASMSSMPTRCCTRLSPAAAHLHPLHLAGHLAASEQGGVTEASPHLRAAKTTGRNSRRQLKGSRQPRRARGRTGHAAGRSSWSRKHRHLGHRSRRSSVDRAKPPQPRGQIRADPAPAG